MNCGYTFLWRKTWANPLLCEPGKRFSRLEAWLYLTNVLAAGMDDEAAGLKRGEFGASSRFLAQKWNWPRSTVQRFFRELETAGMISRIEDPSRAGNHINPSLGHLAGQLAGHQENHFIVRNYETYNPARATLRATDRAILRAKYKRSINAGINKVEKDTHMPAGAGARVSPEILLEIYRQQNQSLPEVKALTTERLRKCRSRIDQAVRDGCLEQRPCLGFRWRVFGRRRVSAAIMEGFRRLLLQRLHQAGRLSENFMRNLLSWVHPGFSVFAGPPVEAAALTSLESQARYITRPALAMDALQKLDDGRLALETPPDPRTGATLLILDPLEWIQNMTAHIPDPGRHCQRFYGAYSNRARATISSADGDSAGSAANTHPEQDNADFSREARSTWARLLRKIFEVDPLVCACGARMQIVSFITDPRVVARILCHRESERCKTKDPFEPRAPPTDHMHTRQ